MFMSKNASSTQLILFSKAPELGRVKTRMQPQLTQEQSVQLHQDLTFQALHNIHSWEQSSTDHITQLSISGSLDHPFICGQVKNYPNLTLSQQVEGDLGTKMAKALAKALERDDHAMIMGADCPFIDKDHLEEVVASLGFADLVLTPAMDGGYVLIAAKQCLIEKLDDLLSNVDWGTERVLEQTLSNATRLGIKVSCTAPLPDIDHVEDLLCLKDNHRVSSELQGWGELAHRLAGV